MSKVTGNRPVQTPSLAREVNAGQSAARAPAAEVAKAPGTGIDKLQVELPSSAQAEARSLPAQSDAASLGQNRGLLGVVNLLASGADAAQASPPSSAADRFAAALAEKGVTLSRVEARAGDPPTIFAEFGSREDFDVARALLTSTRSGTPTFEGVVVDWRLGGLPPGA